MLDLAWSELAVIGLIAVLVLGPKELPQAMRTIAKLVRKMRNLSSELQGHMNDIVREAELDEVRQSIQKFSATNIKAEIEKAVDPDGKLSAQMNAPLESDTLTDTAAAGQAALPPGESPATESAPESATESAPPAPLPEERQEPDAPAQSSTETKSASGSAAGPSTAAAP